MLQFAGLPPREEDPSLLHRQTFWLIMIAACELQEIETEDHFTDQHTSYRPFELYQRRQELETACHEEYEEFLRSLGDKIDTRIYSLPQGSKSMQTGLAPAQVFRKLMHTRDRRLGLIPEHARVGDVVAVLTGGHVPLVLRPEGG